MLVGWCWVCGGNRGLLDVGVSVLKRINYIFSRVAHPAFVCVRFLHFFFCLCAVCGWCVVCGGIGGLLDVRGRCGVVWCGVTKGRGMVQGGQDVARLARGDGECATRFAI